MTKFDSLHNANFFENYLVVKNHGSAPFYAADLGLNGGAINALAVNNIIKKTGNTKTVFSEMGYTGLYQKVAVYEWVYNESLDDLMMGYLKDEAAEILRAAELVKALGLVP